MRTHEVAIEKSAADAIISGDRTFDIRFNSGEFQKGDYLHFRAYRSIGDDRAEHIKHNIGNKKYQITYVLSGCWLRKNCVVMGIKEVSE